LGAVWSQVADLRFGKNSSFRERSFYAPSARGALRGPRAASLLDAGDSSQASHKIVEAFLT